HVAPGPRRRACRQRVPRRRVRRPGRARVARAQLSRRHPGLRPIDRDRRDGVVRARDRRVVIALLAALPASIPSPSGSGISIGPLNLRMYGLMIALGVIAAVWLCGRLFEEKGIGTKDDAGSIAMWGVIAGVSGSRLYHVATDWHRFSDDLGSIPRIWEGGLGIPGGIAGEIGRAHV